MTHTNYPPASKFPLHYAPSSSRPQTHTFNLLFSLSTRLNNYITPRTPHDTSSTHELQKSTAENVTKPLCFDLHLLLIFLRTICLHCQSQSQSSHFPTPQGGGHWKKKDEIVLQKLLILENHNLFAYFVKQCCTFNFKS